MISWGKDRNSKQRFRCQNCKITAQRNRKDTTKRNQTRALDSWLIKTVSLTEVGKRYGVSRWTMYRRFSKSDDIEYLFAPDYSDGVIVDATWITTGELLLFLVIQSKNHKPVTAYFGNQETELQWSECFRQIHYIPKYFVCDGHNGLRKAIRSVFGVSVLIQRCLVHVLRFVTTRTTQRPRTRAGKELLHIMSFLCRIRIKDQARRWLFVYDEWKRIHHDFLEEKTIPLNGKGVYVHRNLRRARYHIDRARNDLFTFLEYNGEHTTNAIEGGYNARLSELVRNHRGLNLENRKKLVARYLNIRTQR
jgi:hypothetical protein